jgi:hypothetical protein
MNTKLIIVALLAFTVGGTCPSDVNNDGTVGIQDFLQLLGEWGPCPSVSVIAIDSNYQRSFRLWSDGVIERRSISNPGGCGNLRFGEWEVVPESGTPQGERVVDIAWTSTNSYLVRVWDTGVVQVNAAWGMKDWCGWQGGDR